jgi:hypothetical protein
MLYPLAWLPAEVPPSFGINPADDAAPSVTQSEISRRSAPQQLRPVREYPAPSVDHRPALSPSVLVAQRLQGEEFSVMSKAPEPGADSILLKYGHRNQAIQVLQTYLKELGYYSGAIDGIFGPLTEAGVRSFQRHHSLPVDGVVGPLTWQRLRAKEAAPVTVPAAVPQQPKSSEPRLLKPQPTATFASPSVDLSVTQPSTQLPDFSPGLVPDLTFHGLDAPFPQSHPRVVWITIITVIAAGGAAFYLKPVRTSSASETDSHRLNRLNVHQVHRPQPVYPHARRSARPVHYPEPVYPDIAQEHNRQVEAVLHDLAQQVPWAEQGLASHLSDFLYDLQIADSRQQLEGVVAIVPPQQIHGGHPKTLSKAMPTKRLGTLPAHHHRTKTPYTYMLLSDLGGCFCLINNNELWLTETATTWLNNEEPYTVTIRRLDGNGRVMDKRFTVTISTHQVQMAS